MKTASIVKNRFKALWQRIAALLDYHHLVVLVMRHPLKFLLGLLVVLVTVGTSGYMVIEGWSLLDALYMTTITMTTIGFGEVNSLSAGGRIFTIVLIITGVATASFALTVSFELITSERFLEDLRNRRRRRILSKLNNHCIVCGFGRLGSSLAGELTNRRTQMVAIDLNPDAIERCHKLGIPALEGDAANEQMLQYAGIERATSLVAATKSDAQNVFIILTAKSINPELHIISRCNAEASIPNLEKAGADTVISPYSIAGKRIAHILTHPSVTNFLDGVLEFGDHRMRLEEFVIRETSPLAGLSLKEARLNAVVLAVGHPDKGVFTHPSASTMLQPGTAIIAMGLDKELSKLDQLVKGPC